MGMVHSYNKGDMKDAPASVKKAAKGMTKKSAKDFASTKHKGKPEHVAEALRRLIRQEIRAYNEAKTINVEPNWEGLYRFMMHMRKGDNAAFVRVTRKMGADWKKLEQMAQKKQWYVRGDFSESVNEKVANPFSQHLRDAQEEVEYMISHHPGAAEEGVYDKPKQAIKFLQVAQKALGKIT